MSLTSSQLENIGYSYLLRQMRPASPYGREALRCVRPFAPGQEAALLLEWENIEKTIRCRPHFEREYSRMESLFMQVKDIRASLRRCEGGVLSEVELFEVKRFLLQLSDIAAMFITVNKEAVYREIAFEPVPDALRLLDPEDTRVASFHLSSRYSEQLAQTRREKQAADEELKEAPDNTLREEVLSRRRILAAKEAQYEEEVRAKLSGQLRPWLGLLLENTAAIARLDVTLQKARLAKAHGGVMPVIAKGTIAFGQMRNPMVAAALEDGGRGFIPIDIALTPGAAVITGANMGGKSVALKTVALNVFLALCGFFVFAREAFLPMLGDIYLLNDDLEDVTRGLSSFGGEIVRFNEIVKAADASEHPSLLLLDEFARGTNPREGAAIAQGVCEYLNGRADYSVMTTHFENVASYAAAHYEVAGLKNTSMPVLEERLRAAPLEKRVGIIAQEMDYSLLPVKSGEFFPRDAMNICRILGLRPVIIDKIEAKLLTFEGD